MIKIYELYYPTVKDYINKKNCSTDKYELWKQCQKCQKMFYKFD